jgi:hypothetical protein
LRHGCEQLGVDGADGDAVDADGPQVDGQDVA